MALAQQRVVLDARSQEMVALWAVKTCLLLELAVRQMYPRRRAVEGYAATAQELAWIRATNQPPPRSMVWLGCWDCQREVPVNYEPSSAALPASKGNELGGHLTTFTLGYAAFQVFTVDFVAAEQHRAVVWNTHVPASLEQSLIRVWPPQLVTPDVSWPPKAFANGEWHSMVTWDGALRPPGDAHDRRRLRQEQLSRPGALTARQRAWADSMS
jgi:hypothetical protein